MRKQFLIIFVLSIFIFAACQPNQVEIAASNETTPKVELTEAPATETAVSAPTSEPATATPEPEPATLTPLPTPDKAIVRFAVYDWEKDGYQNLASAFEAENSDIKIEFVSIDELIGVPNSEDAFNELTTHADVLTTGPAYSVIKSGLLLDITPFFEADPTISEEDFFPSLLDPYQRNGGLWGLPLYPYVEFISYNKALFDQAGLDYPQPGWTYDDMLATAQALTIKENDFVTQWGFVQPYALDAMPFLQGQTEQAYNLYSDPPLVYLNTPETIAAIQWYVDLIQTHEVAPNTNESSEPAMNLINNGQAAMWTDFSHDRNVNIVPFPIAIDDSKSSPTYSLGLGISADTPHPEAAWAWLSYLSANPVPTTVGTAYTPLPARQSVAESSGCWDKLDAEKAVAYRFALDHAYAKDAILPYSPVNNELYDILAGNKDIPTAMANAQTNAEMGLEMIHLEQEHQETTP